MAIFHEFSIILFQKFLIAGIYPGKIMCWDWDAERKFRNTKLKGTLCFA
jgi:hypothetical protein